jgi:hypothetical protein
MEIISVFITVIFPDTLLYEINEGYHETRSLLLNFRQSHASNSPIYFGPY